MLFDAKTPEIAAIVRASFPDNHKPAVGVEVYTPKNINSFGGDYGLVRSVSVVHGYWDEGSKDEYVFVRLEDHKAIDVPTSHPYYDCQPDGMGNVELAELPEGVMAELPEGVVLVHGGYFMGEPRQLTIYTRPDGLAAG